MKVINRLNQYHLPPWQWDRHYKNGPKLTAKLELDLEDAEYYQMEREAEEQQQQNNKPVVIKQQSPPPPPQAPRYVETKDEHGNIIKIGPKELAAMMGANPDDLGEISGS